MPPIESVSSFIDEAQAQGLLTTEQVYTINIALLGRVKNARVLGLELVQRGWLTLFQVNEILKGLAHELNIGPYRVIDCMGKGGTSAVYKALDTKTGKFVALKVIHPDLLTNADTVDNFHRELWAIAQLKHPNIVQTVGVGQASDRQHYFAMEFLEGYDLGKLVEHFGPPPVDKACEYIRQAALGLEHAHEHCLVHRDIKPANILLTPEPPFPPVPATSSSERVEQSRVVWARTGVVVKVIDWGLVQLRLPTSSHRQIAKSAMREQLLGTVDYCSPEQASDPDSVDIRGDIYSLGCTFYFVLTGHPPFPGGSLLQRVLRHKQSEPTPVEQIRPEVPSGVSAILKRMLEKDREKRFRTPAAIAAQLAQFSSEYRPSGKSSLRLPSVSPSKPT